jgi:23S rRNA pseudouridine1911/1915/1917 synthase
LFAGFCIHNGADYTLKKYFITLKNDNHGQRLDKVIPELLTQFSRGQVRKFISAGAVSVDGKRAKKHSRIVCEGQTITIYDAETTLFKTDEIPDVPIIYDDPWFVVISKPSGMPSDETLSGKAGTAVDVMSRKFAHKTIRSVHRLDMGTSGIMVLSKTAAATRDLNRQFQERLIRKTYSAIVHGHPIPDASRIQTRMDRDQSDVRKHRSVPTGGKEAISEYKTLRSVSCYSLLEIEIFTGRTHQIRVHLSELGHPVVGDKLYGLPNDSAKRLMLHATTLAFKCPRTGESLSLRSDLPQCFDVFFR